MVLGDALPVGVGCRLRDAIRVADKSENDRDIWRREHDQRAEVGKQPGGLPQQVFFLLGTHTCALALNATMEACFGTGFNPVDNDAGGRISLRCSRNVANTLRKGIRGGGGLGDPCRIKKPQTMKMCLVAERGTKQTRGSAERGHEGKGKGKGFGRGLQWYGCAPTHP